jgi:hypothetical protein
MPIDPEDDVKADKRSFTRRTEIMAQGFIGEAAFHGSLIICVLVSLYLRILG